MSIFVTDKGQQGHHHSLTKGETVRLTTVCRKCKQHRGAVLVSIVLFATGGLSGILFQKYYSVGHLLQGVEGRSNTASTASVPMHRAEIPLSSVHAKRVMVALVFGQSNAANFGESPHTAREGVYNFYQGKLYAAQDPLLGAHGDGGSVWTRLGNKLIASQHYDAVVFIALGIGGAPLARWKPDGDLHPRLLEAIQDVQAHHRFDHACTVASGRSRCESQNQPERLYDDVLRDGIKYQAARCACPHVYFGGYAMPKTARRSRGTASPTGIGESVAGTVRRA